jgi:ABC-2 type transport system permease protein
MRQLIQMFFMDIRMLMKNFMGAYVVIVPFVILIVLSTFLPSVESSTVTFAIVTEGENAVTDEKLLAALDEFGNIEKYDSVEKMKQRLRGIGSAEGLYWKPSTQQYISMVERTIEENQLFSTAAIYIRQNYYRKNYPEAVRVTEFSSKVPPELENRTKASPVATMGGAIFLTFMVFILSYVIGIGIVTDKEYGTNLAIQVSPVNKVDYYIGKSLFPLILIVFYTIIALLILGLMHVNILQVYTVALSSFFNTLLFGLLIGALAKNEVESIGIVKLLGVILALVVLGAAILPDSWKWITYWAPFYWVFNMYEGIFTETITWIEILWKSGLTIGLSGLYFLLLHRKIIKGLS